MGKDKQKQNGPSREEIVTGNAPATEDHGTNGNGNGEPTGTETADLAGTTAQTVNANPRNPWDQVFGAVRFAPATSQIYPSKDGRSKSVKVASVVVELASGCGIVNGSIYIRKTGNQKPVADFSFTGRPASIQPLTAADKRNLEEWQGRVTAAYRQWQESAGPLAVRSGGSTAGTTEIPGADDLFN